jgi:hypothetical protein
LEQLLMSLPIEYKENKIPQRELAPLDMKDIVSKVALLSDPLLGKQIRYLMSFHGVLRAALKLSTARGDLELGTSGGRTPLDKEHVGMVSAVRKELVGAQQMQSSLASGEDPFYPIGDVPGHLKALDGAVQPFTLGPLLSDKVKAELAVWAAEWGRMLDKQTDAINEGVPVAWQTKKDQLLHKDNEHVVHSLVSNPNYMIVSQGVALLTTLLHELRGLTQGGCGPFVNANGLKLARQAQVLGTDTVAITYATFKLQNQIAKEVILEKRQGLVKALRAEMKEKGVVLGASLDEECARLSC